MDHYVVMYHWMLGLVGRRSAEKLIYAIIYSFTVSGKTYTGGLRYLMEYTNASKMTVLRALQDLTERKLILKTEHFVNGVKYCEYVANEAFFPKED